MFEQDLTGIIENALAEDLDSHGDITSTAVIPAGVTATAAAIAKEAGVICGLEVFSHTFMTVDPGSEVSCLVGDGDRVEPGQVIATVRGAAGHILAAERTALNFLQHLSGIATRTAAYVKQCEGTKAVVMDTRKTTPGLRTLEKYAVKVGGGVNHRMGLFDAVLIKDNHIAACTSLTLALEQARQAYGHDYPVEVEVSSIEEVREASELDIDVIMLDNFSIEDIVIAKDIIKDKALIEVSGGVTIDNIAMIARTGIDRISSGALTQSAKALDISLELSIKP